MKSYGWTPYKGRQELDWIAVLIADQVVVRFAGYCLMRNRQKLFGHVFSGRYKAVIVEGSGNGYLRTACDYVHLNPVRAQAIRV